MLHGLARHVADHGFRKMLDFVGEKVLGMGETRVMES